VPLDVIHSIAKEIKQPTDVVLVYLLKDRFPRLASVDYELGALVDEFAAKLNL